MRASLLLLAPALLAQTPAQPPKPDPVQPDSKVHVAAPPKVCSIPLINVLKDEPKTVDDKILVSPPKGHYAVKYVTPPAPPCDDGKR